MAGELSFYFHIPFSGRDNREGAGSGPGSGCTALFFMRFVRALLERTDRALDFFSPSCIPAVFIGGGSLCSLGEGAAFVLLDGLRRRLGAVDEFSVEAAPESLSEEFLKAAEGSGVNRISLGVQTYSDELLKRLGRPDGLDGLLKGEEVLRRCWNGGINRDLLAALSPQADRLKRDLDAALADDPGHISLYDFVPGEEAAPGGVRRPFSGPARKKGRLPGLPGEDERIAEWEAALAHLESAEYRRYDSCHFARKGHECRYLGICGRLEPYLGIGPGAASTVPGAAFSFGKAGRPAGPGETLPSASPGPAGRRCAERAAMRLTETADLGRWLRTADAIRTGARSFRDALLTDTGAQALSPNEFALEHFITGLRTAAGLNRLRFTAVFGTDPLQIAPRAFRRGQTLGLLQITPYAAAPTAAGFDRIESTLADIAVEIEGRLPDSYAYPHDTPRCT